MTSCTEHPSCETYNETEKLLHAIAHADLDKTHYLTSSGQVKPRCFCGRVVKACKLHKFEWIRKKYFNDGNIEEAKQKILELSKQNVYNPSHSENFFSLSNEVSLKIADIVAKKEKTKQQELTHQTRESLPRRFKTSLTRSFGRKGGLAAYGRHLQQMNNEKKTD